MLTDKKHYVQEVFAGISAEITNNVKVYVRTKEGKVKAVLTGIHFGFPYRLETTAVCHEKDVFDETTGVLLALVRLRNKYLFYEKNVLSKVWLPRSGETCYLLFFKPYDKNGSYVVREIFFDYDNISHIAGFMENRLFRNYRDARKKAFYYSFEYGKIRKEAISQGKLELPDEADDALTPDERLAVKVENANKQLEEAEKAEQDNATLILKSYPKDEDYDWINERADMDKRYENASPYLFNVDDADKYMIPGSVGNPDVETHIENDVPMIDETTLDYDDMLEHVIPYDNEGGHADETE